MTSGLLPWQVMPMCAPRPTRPPFTFADAERAFDDWGANCGPVALAAMVGMTLEQVRPHLRGFEAKGYTNPTMMFEGLRSVGVPWQLSRDPRVWPAYGLQRVQFEGPWTMPGVPPRVRYRYTHWIGAATHERRMGVFDVNCLQNGTGWVERAEWERVVVPALCAHYPRADGGWHVTHAIEIGRPRS